MTAILCGLRYDEDNRPLLSPPFSEIAQVPHCASRLLE
jgi:hypothetical protein